MRCVSKWHSSLRVLAPSMLGSRNLLDLFLIEKAACEIAYEAAHRPTWIGVLIAGLARSSVGLTVRETGAGMADHPHLEAEWLHAIAHILIATKRCLGLFAQLTQLNVACELVGRLPLCFDQRISEQTSHFLKSDIGRKRRRQLSVPSPFSQIRLSPLVASE